MVASILATVALLYGNADTPVKFAPLIAGKAPVNFDAVNAEILASATVPVVICDPLRAVKAAPFKAGRVPLAVILAADKAVNAAPLRAGKVPLAVIFPAANAVIPAPAPVSVVAATVPAMVTTPDVRVITFVSAAIPILPFPPESTIIVELPNPVPAVPSNITTALSVLLAGTVI